MSPPAAALALALGLAFQPFNYDESRVPPYTVPDPLVATDGTHITDARAWLAKRRPEILSIYTDQVFGRSPGRPPGMRFVVTSVDRRALGGRATRKEISIHFSASSGGPRLDLLLYVPNGARKPVPAFLGANFYGNHAVHKDPGITMSTGWMLPRADKGMINNQATEASRGTEAAYWQVERLIERGYALATFYHGDVDPHFDDGFQNGVHPLFYRPGQTRPGPAEWGSIAAWSWGLIRAMDYIDGDGDIDRTRVAIVGHSMMGKVVLWAAALDPRFAMVVANDSGEGGAALARRKYGQTMEQMIERFPHLMCANFTKHAKDPTSLPVDQHMLIALLAPRPVYVASAIDDKVADPRGEFLGARHAEPVYRLFGRKGLGVEDMPPVDHPVGDVIGYHVRTGGHAVTAWDWERFLAFADRHLPARDPAQPRTPVRP